MILGTSFKCLASKLLLILTWCDIVVQVICYSCVDAGSFSGGISITSAVGGGDSSSSPVSSLLNGGHYIGGTGSVLLLMTFLCINFQDVNSMSDPRQQLNKLPGFSKQGSAKKRPSKQDGKKKKTKKKKNKSKSAHKAKSTESPETNDGEYGKSKLISLPGSPTPSPSSTNINNWNGVNPPVLPAPHQNILYGKDSGSSPSIRDNKRKSDRLGQNANVISSGSALAAASAVASGSSLMGSLFMNENEEEALRRKILAKIDDLDPLMCLPKVLCGYSNRRRHKNYSNFPIRPTTTTTPRPILAESLIDEYVKLLKIIRPGVSGEEEQEQEKEQSDDTKKNGKKKNNKKKRPLRKKKKKKVEESEEEEEEGEESEESDESNESRKAIKKPKSKYKKSKKSSFDSVPDEDEEEEVDDDDDDNREEEEEEEGDEEYDDDGEEGLIDFDDDHVKHVKKRARMEKLMDTSGQYSDENWWTDLDDNNLKLPLSYEPPSKPTTSTRPNGGGWLSSMMNMVSPLISWGLGGSKDDGDDFKDDPFFLESRSLKGGVSGGGESRSLKSNGTLPTISSSRRGKTMDLEKLFGILDTDKVDYTKEKDPWTNKFRVAVELGRRISSPSQCDFIYNGCPLSYEEILAIINEPLKQATTTTTTTTPAPTTKNMSFTHHYITLPPPIIMQLPLQHQYHQYHNPYLLPQQHQQSPYHQPVQHQQQQQQHQQMHYHHPVHHQQPQYHHQQLQNQHNIQHQQHQQHEQPQMEQNYNQNQQFQQPKPTSFNDLYAQVLKKPQKATIKQSMPSGEEFHINLLYDSMRKTGLAEKQVQTTTTRTTTAEASVEEDDDNNSSSSSGSSSAGNDDPLSYKVLKYHNNNFLQRQPLYSIRRRNDEKTKPTIMKDVVPVSTTGTGGSNSNSNSAEESMELNPLTPANSIATDNMMRQQVRPSAVPFTKVEGKYKYKQLLKGTKAPPRRQSSKEKFKQQQRNRKGNEDRSKNPRRKTKKKTKTPSYYESNSITRFSNHSKKRKAERFKNHHHSFQPKRKHKTHLHKQSSVRIGVKNRRKIPAPNARRPDYGHRFPTSYGGHYRKPKPSTPSYLPNSFFNYLFGKPYI